MKKKRLLSWFLAMVMVLGMLPVTAWAKETEEPVSITVNVTISNKGDLVVAYEAVEVTDQDNDGKINIDETLRAVHKKYYCGVTSGYNSAIGDYGLAITELWGDTSGSFGYYVNDASAWSLADEVKNGDKVVAFVYKDANGWSDKYSFFDKNDVAVKLEEGKAEITLTLGYQYWDTDTNNYAFASVPSAAIAVDEKPITDTEGNTVTTNMSGQVTLSFDKVGTYLVSATHDAMNIIPPVCVVTVTDELDSGSGTENEGGSVPDGEEEDNKETGGENGEGGDQDKTPVEIKTLMENIAESYVDNSGEWVIMDMAAYEDLDQKNYDGLDLKDYYTSKKAKQKYINGAIESISTDSVGETTYAKAALSLTALGINAEELYPAGSERAISAFNGLKQLKQSYSEWVTPYTLMAYGQKEDETTEELEDNLIQMVLEKQNGDGSWGGGSWDNGIQTTANMIAALAFYNDEDGVEEAIGRAVDFLALSQNENGNFYDYADNDGIPYADGNTAAIVVIGLCAAGINPDTDEDFVKGEVSALDALMSFVREDDGFYWRPGYSLDATEQGFRALIAASQVMKTGKAFNIYDFSHNSGDDLESGCVEEIEEETPSRPSHKNDDITVEVSIKTIDEYWMKNKDVTVDEDATVYDAFMEAIDNSDIEQEGAEKGYISSMTKDGEELGEFDKGKNSGWLYEVNNKQPDVGIKNYRLKDGDEILFYYTEDWTEDKDALSRNEEEKTEEVLEEIVEEVQEKEPLELPVLEEIYTDISADGYYYEAAQWAVANGIVSGVTETEFGPEWECSRGQLMTLIWRLMGKPEPRTQTIPYADVDKDMYYHDAILWAVENKLANGTDAISFSPEMTLTRGQAVAFLWRAAGMPEPAGETDFGDVNEEDYFHKAVLWAAENGITSGTDDNMFSPEAPCTRGQIVTFLYRCFGK